MNNILDCIIKDNSKLVILSLDDSLPKNLESLHRTTTKTILIDDNFDEFLFEKFIFDSIETEVLIFVNNTDDEKQFTSKLVSLLLKIFEERGEFKSVILYQNTKFKYKNELPKISILCPVIVNKSSIEYKYQNILYVGQYGTSGYASAAKGYIADYVLQNKNITWSALKFDDSQLDDTCYVDTLAKSAINKNYSRYDTAIFHSTPDLWNKLSEKYKSIKDIKGYCTWETNRLPDEWVDYINQLEQVLVPSTFNKETFIESGVKSDIKVVPHLWFNQVLPEKSSIKITDYFGNIIPNDKYTYYCIAELNNRKGILDLITVFDRIYETNKDCQLILKLHYKNYEKKNIDFCLRQIVRLTRNLNTSIYLVLKNINNKELLSLHSFGDCYVSLNKGEGFGLTIFDAFKFNKKIVTTGYGGQLDFLGKEHDGLVTYQMVPVTGMNKFSKNYTDEQRWAQPDLDHAKYLMEKL